MKPDGGPAFPAQWQNDGDRNATAPDGQVVPPEGIAHMQGMSLRDYFAAMALPEILADPAGVTDVAKVATIAYQFADAMLAERSC